MTSARRLKLKRQAVLAAAALFGALLLVFALDRLFPPPIERAGALSVVAEDRHGRALRAFPVENGRWRLAADLDRIDPAFIEALLTIEDQRFYDHPGVDPLAVIRASAQAVSRGRIVSGASTITMQTARLLEPRPRTLGSKIIESIRALQLEARLSKDEILELYLTLAPYGGNLQGVRAASWAWFGREPDQLTPDQIALLIALPQSPEARRPDLRPEVARRSRAAILTRLAAAGWISAARAEDAATEALPTGRNAFPREAWHAAATIRARGDGAPVVRSTLDLTLQLEAERLVERLAEAGGEGVQASAIIVDIETRAVRAAVGSAGLSRAGGWIDLTTSRRSPGSTLKPLVYALAFDDGQAAPDTLIDDLPARFSNYQPENFDRTFRGEVTVADALQHSLNVPAVRVLDRVGAARFAAALDQAGADPAIPGSLAGETGLAVALGGLGLSVRDLAVLYAALGDEGRALPLAWTEAEAEANLNAQPGHLVSAESAAEIVEVLYGSPSPPGRMPAHLTTGAPRVAYKTGTSYGFRDAWAAGITGGYAIIVWTGRPDAAPRPGVTGRAGALPTLFDLADAVERWDPAFENDAPGREAAPAPAPLVRFAPDNAAPVILFPPEDSELWAEGAGRNFVLSARGAGPMDWYVDGEPAARDAGGASVFTPDQPGFYALTVVDAEGRSAQTRVRVRMAGQG
ncbi:MAG: penicillin-binding protein 1C [Alphaproteobacteria bacterium]|nr:penicillin-binding protein 1C [Alphaproteobacteria bacterium]